MRRAPTVALGVLVLTLAGCDGGDGETPDADRLAKEAEATIRDLEEAIAGREFERICASLLSAEVRRQAGAGECPAMLRRTSAGIERPRIEIEKIRIQGSAAIVEVMTTARGQAPAEDTIRLVREGGRYRISSLSG